MIPGRSNWGKLLAERLVERASTDLARMPSAELNRLILRFYRFRTDDPGDGPVEVRFNGLVVTAPGATWSVEGDERLTEALAAAFNRLDAEISRRIPQTVEARWSRCERYERRQQRLARRKAEAQPVVRVARNREQRPREHRTSVGSGRDPPASSEDDEPHDQARRALGPAGASPAQASRGRR